MADGEWHLLGWWHRWESNAVDKAGTVAPIDADKPPTTWPDRATHQIWLEAAVDGRGAHRLVEHQIGAAR